MCSGARLEQAGRSRRPCCFIACKPLSPQWYALLGEIAAGLLAILGISVMDRIQPADVRFSSAACCSDLP